MHQEQRGTSAIAGHVFDDVRGQRDHAEMAEFAQRVQEARADGPRQSQAVLKDRTAKEAPGTQYFVLQSHSLRVQSCARPSSGDRPSSPPPNTNRCSRKR